MDSETLQQLALAVGLGLLVGFQREWTAPHVAGIRTFALLTVMGTLSGQLAEATSLWMLPVGFLVVGGVLAVGTFARLGGDEPPGLTTHTAALVMYLVGAGLVFLPWELPILVTGLVALLLHWKEPIHTFVERMGENDVRAIIQLVLLALVVLPVLPDKTYDRFGVLNPFEIWLLVVLICGITLGGYIAYRFLGENVGTLVSGFLGGVISSTATAVSYSRSSKKLSDATPAALVIAIASTVVFARVFVEVAVVDARVLAKIWPPFLVLMGVMAAVSAGLFSLHRPSEQPEAESPPARTDLRAAITFGGLYAAVLLAVSFAKESFGDAGLYAVAALSGLTDMDAITLSTTRMIGKGRIDLDTGWRMILIGVLANLVFKTGIVAVLGNRRLLGRVASMFGVALIVGLLLLLLWPRIA